MTEMLRKLINIFDKKVQSFKFLSVKFESTHIPKHEEYLSWFSNHFLFVTAIEV